MIVRLYPESRRCEVGWHVPFVARSTPGIRLLPGEKVERVE